MGVVVFDPSSVGPPSFNREAARVVDKLDYSPAQLFERLIVRRADGWDVSFEKSAAC